MAAGDGRVRWTGLIGVTPPEPSERRRLPLPAVLPRLSALIIGHRVLTDCFDHPATYGQYNCDSGKDAPIRLTKGNHPITVMYQDQDIGAAAPPTPDRGDGRRRRWARGRPPP
jgi:hypothetical protein